MTIAQRSHSGRPSSRGEILDAATRVVQQEGAGRLTIEGVAREAGLSKGGVLYNYPTKEALVAALNERMVDRFEEAAARYHAHVAGRPNPTLAALVAAYRERRSAEPQVVNAVLAAAAENPRLLDTWREAFRAQQRALCTEAEDPLGAMILWLALGGLMLFDALEVLDLPEGLLARLIDGLEDRSAEV